MLDSIPKRQNLPARLGREFGLQEEESFGLFDNNESHNAFAEEKKESEEDELEIPAFLRRQKN